MSVAEQGINQPADLTGKTVGLPGLYGASFIGWKALVYAAGLDESAITVEEIGFTQAAAVQQKQVDAAIVYIANEPNQLRSQGLDINVIQVSDYINLVSNGLVTGETLLTDNPELVQRMTRATLRGITYTIDHPDEAFAIAREIIPEITDETAPTQRQVLDSSIELFESDAPGLSRQEDWQASVEFMQQTGLLEQTVEVEQLFTNRFVEQK